MFYAFIPFKIYIDTFRAKNSSNIVNKCMRVIIYTMISMHRLVGKKYCLTICNRIILI